MTLKVGAPVILLKNLTSKLYNGSKGTVHSFNEDSPVINFNGVLYTIHRATFDQFDTRANKVRASRLQFPLKLAFALTVHKAQGQTIPFLEVDCYSFFAPGQLGVAIGRAVSIKNLRMRNYNIECATLKHLPHVYNFYQTCNSDDTFHENFSCCHSTTWAGNQTSDDSAPVSEHFSANPWPSIDYINKSTSVDVAPRETAETEDLMNELDCQPPDGVVIPQNRLVYFVAFIQQKLNSVLPAAGKNKDAWSDACRKFHQFLLSDEYKKQLCLLFETVSVTPACNGFATQLAFNMNDVMVARRADEIRQCQATQGNCAQALSDMSDAGKAKVRYVAGACLATVSRRLRSKALANITNTIQSHRRRHAYRQQRLLACLRISESDLMATTSEPQSLEEINSKQSASKGLFHIPDPVFHFFLQLHTLVGKHLSPAYFNLYRKRTFFMCRDVIFGAQNLKSVWLALFPEDDTSDEIEKTLSESLVQELYEQVSEHYLRISFVDALHLIKEKLPKTKKQALRA